jgi:phosphopantetheinyl transferase (holo-ACP synthase)
MTVPDDVVIELPRGFALGHALVEGDPHAAGRLAAQRALARFAPPRATSRSGAPIPMRPQIPTEPVPVAPPPGAPTPMRARLETGPVPVVASPRHATEPGVHAPATMGRLDDPPRLAYDGTRPIVVGADLAISITHGRTRAIAVVAPVARVGIDLVDDPERVARLAERYLSAERSFANSPRELAACFAAKEAGLKALGLGLLDGGMFDDRAVRVLSLDPPRLEGLTLVLGSVPEGVLALAY